MTEKLFTGTLNKKQNKNKNKVVVVVVVVVTLWFYVPPTAKVIYVETGPRFKVPFENWRIPGSNPRPLVNKAMEASRYTK